jgi:hypothetical protein
MKAVNPLLPRDPLVLNNKMPHLTVKASTNRPITRRRARHNWRYVYTSITAHTAHGIYGNGNTDPVIPRASRPIQRDLSMTI